MKGAIDIGSNSLLLTVVGDDGVVLHDEAQVVGLGKGMGERGLFRTERMDAAMSVLRSFAETSRRLGLPPERIAAVATSASRRAMNAATFYQKVKEQTGIAVEVISGEEEALLTYRGGVSGLELPPGPVLLCDPGGGSTEIILGEGPSIRYRTSLEIGTVRLTEQFLGYGPVDVTALSRLREAVDAAVRSVELPATPRTAVAVAGTATTLVAVELGLPHYDPARVHGANLSNQALRKLVDRLIIATPEERRQVIAVSPERADTVLAGAVILLRVLELARRNSFRISDRGLRYGVLDSKAR